MLFVATHSSRSKILKMINHSMTKRPEHLINRDNIFLIKYVEK